MPSSSTSNLASRSSIAVRKTLSLPAAMTLCVLTLLAPSVIYMLLELASMSTGVLFGAALWFTWFLVAVDKSHIFTSARHVGYLVGCGLIFIYIHAAVVLVVNEGLDIGRFLAAFAYLVVFLFGTFSFATFFKTLPDVGIGQLTTFIFILFCVAGIAGLVGWSPFSFGHYPKPVLFFPEPSHFAILFLPFLLHVSLMSGPLLRLLCICFGALLAVGLPNLTLAVGVIVIGVLTLPLGRLTLFLLIGAAVFMQLEPDYFHDRLAGLAAGGNISTAVYLSGWERAYLNTIDTSGLGLGLLQFGAYGNQGGKYMDEVIRLAYRSLNVRDGGTVGAKLLGEFGLIGLFALVVYTGLFFRVAFRIRSIASKKSVHGKALATQFFLCCIAMFSIDIFVRGIGYFSQTGFLFAAALFYFLPPTVKLRN